MTDPAMNSCKEAKLLIVEDDRNLGELLREEAEDAGLAARLVNTAEEALQTIGAWMPDLVVSDLRLPGADGLALLRKIRLEWAENSPDVLIVTAFGNVATAVESLKAGAEDFLTKPVDLEHFMLTVRRILEKRALRKEIRHMQRLMGADGTFHGMVGRSRAMQNLFQQIRRVAKADGPVLIIGESGTGKELVAQAVHAESHQTRQPFLAVNCAGIPEPLLESEFFGHAAGAFTGAAKARQGLFSEAENGSLLLDEVSEMPPTLQVKLLRMLQDGKIRPVGSNHEQQVNVRVLAATQHDLEQRVREEKFREDLFYRLETFTLHVPPLRERDDDLELLAAAFLAKQSYAARKTIRGFTRQALDLLRRYPFPGNVRELQNAVERATVYCTQRDIRPEHLPPRIQHYGREASALMTSARPWINAESLTSLKDVEEEYIRHVLDKVGGNKRLAASILGITRRTLYRRLEAGPPPASS